nr:hypothetical protein [Tanacetum cinerariifolium]
LHEPSLSTTLSKLDHPEQSSEQEISPTTFDIVLTLSQSKARARATTIIYKRLKKQKSSSGLDFTDADIPAGGLDSAGGLVSAGGVDYAGGLTSAGISVAAGPTVLAERSSPLRDPSKGKAVATPSSHVTTQTDKELADQQAAILEAERQELLEQELKQSIDAKQVYLDSWTWKDVRGLTDDQLQIVMKSFHNTTQPAELQETTTVSASDPIHAVTFVSAGFSVSAATLIAAGVSTTAGASGSANRRTGEPLRKCSRKKFIARKRTLPSPSKPKFDALPFDEDDPEAAFKRYLRQASDDDEHVEPVSLALVSDITTWEVIPTEFGRGEIHVITRTDGTVKRFSTLRELMYWADRADLMVLYGLVLDKYKTERAT